jgi:PAS domain S-box-containing protein
MTIFDIRPPEEVRILKKMLTENKSDTRVTGYWRHKRKDGSIIFAEVYSHKVKYPPHKDARLVTIIDVTKRKKAEDGLIQSEQRFRDLAELLPQTIFEIDLEGNLLYCNQKAFETFKYPIDTDITKINIFNLIAPEHLQLAKENLSQILKGEQADKIEYTLFKKDGRSFVAIVLFSPILKDNKPIGFRGLIVDISELKNVHQELLNSQNKYSSLFENAQSIMIILEPETGRFVDVNKAAVNFYGYPIEQFRKMSLSDIATASEEDLKNSVNKAMNFEQNRFIRLHKLSNERTKFVEVFTSPILISGKNYLFSVIHDVQDRILAENNLKKLNKVIEQSPVSVVITNTDGKIEYVNPKFCEITGYTKEEAFGKNPRILKSGEQNDIYYKNLWTTITSGKNWYGEFKNKKKNGDFYWESVSISPLFDDDGRITHFVAIKEDITERKARENELLSAKEAAEESSRLKSNFLANMSHELRTPLVGILGYADILSNELIVKDHKEMATTILQSGNQLIETLNSILDLSRIEANRNELDIRTYDLYDIINDSYTVFRSLAKSKNLYLKLNVPSKNLFVDTDRQLLIKIFNNLINNAIKFTSQGGVTISANVIMNDNKLLIHTEVADTGIGIPEKYHHLIFEPFRQVSEGLSRNFTGTGLGLTLTKKFVELLKGNISFKSQQGEGTTFTITLPYSHAHPNLLNDEELQTDKISTELKLKTKPSILLVEDDIVNAQIVCAYLSPYFNIEHVEDGQTSIDYCKKKKFDAILMDIALKGISGTVAMHEIKKLNEHYAQIPVIAITAFAMLGDKESFLNAGFSHYISKPFTRSQLFDLLIHIFENGK